jgi:hypothetical protein
MRLEEITLTEALYNSEFANVIRTKCSDYIQILEKVPHCPLLRGTRKVTSSEYFYGKSIDERIPKTSSYKISKEIDNGLKSLGVEARRLNSIYVTSRFRLAQQFGTVFEIFPINGFNFTWCTNGDDLVLDKETVISYKGYSYNQEFKDAVMDYIENYQSSKPSIAEDNYYNIICQILDLMSGDHPELIELLLTRLPSYHPINKQFITFEQRTQFDINALVKHLGLQADTNLKEAMGSRHEIWIKGSYIAIRAGEFLYRTMLFGDKYASI